MRATILTAITAIAIATSACGGDNPPPKTPDEAPAATATAPAAPTETASATPAPSETAPAPATPPPAPEPPAINVAAMKFSPKGGKMKAMELKGDGSVVVADKVVGKITADQVQDAEGKTLLTVSKDGSISGDALAKPVKFQGDELTGDDGYKVTVGDDGTVNVTMPKGKASEVGKVDNVSGSKRAAALLVAWTTIVKPQKAAAAGKGTPTGTAGGGKKKK